MPDPDKGDTAQDRPDRNRSGAKAILTRGKWLLVLAAVLGLSWVYHALTPYRFVSDRGWCLSHSRENLVFFPNPRRPRGIPDFVAPSDFRLPSLHAPAGATGLVVSYTKIPTFSTRRPELHRGRMGCERVPQGNGLSRLVGEGLKNCSVKESPDWHEEWFEPTELFDDLDGVFVRCGLHPAIVNCNLTGLMDNGWEAQATLPKDRLDDWREAAVTARDYFDTYLTDCSKD